MTRAAHERYEPKLFRGSSHAWALQKLRALPRESRIVDIGAGSGIIGRELQRVGFSELHAVEIDPATRAHIAPHYRRVEAALDHLDGGPFDAALLLDVLEHLDNPDYLLDAVIERLNPGGSLYISVPNIAHWSVRLGLLFGFFEMAPRGILDQTHRHFFTRRRLRHLIQTRPVLHLIEFGATISPAQFVLPTWATENRLFDWTAEARLWVARTFPGIAAYQHLVHLRKHLAPRAAPPVSEVQS